MRIAAIGCRLDHPSVEPLAFRSSASLVEYDLVVWDPSTLFAEYAADVERPGEPPVLSVAASDAILEEARYRREDMRRFLDRGRCLVVRPPAPAAIRMHTMEDIVDFGVLEPLPLYGIATQALAPTATRADAGEPFSSFHRDAGPTIRASAAMGAFPGSAVMRAVDGDAVVGAYSYRHPGHLLLTPLPDPGGAWTGPEADHAFVDALITLVRKLTAPNLVVDLPAWADDHVSPEERAIHEQLTGLWAELDAVKAQIRKAEQRQHTLLLQKAVFAGGGRLALQGAASLLAEAGFTVMQSFLSDHSLIAERDGAALLLLVATPETDRVQEDTVIELETLLAQARAIFGDHVAGLLVCSPQPAAAPERRPDPPLSAAARARAADLGVAWLSGISFAAALTGDGADDRAERLLDTARDAASAPRRRSSLGAPA